MNKEEIKDIMKDMDDKTVNWTPGNQEALDKFKAKLKKFQQQGLQEHTM